MNYARSQKFNTMKWDDVFHLLEQMVEPHFSNGRHSVTSASIAAISASTAFSSASISDRSRGGWYS